VPDIRFTRRFSMAHRLLAEADSKCIVPHGHNEFVQVTLRSDQAPDFGGSNYVASFDRLKSRWHGFIDRAVDHAFQLNAADPLLGWFLAHEPARASRLMIFQGDPTSEALAIALRRKLDAILKDEASPFRCVGLTLEETPTNAVIVGETLSAGETAWMAGSWMDRPDLSINDLDVIPCEPAA
jgi:6-pyruvoyltetrahydropterin/6-carboxytetrahydropterin synthase